MSFSERGAGQDVQFHGTLLLIQELSKISAAVALESSMVGNPSMIRSPSSKLGLNADSVIHRGLNSLFAAKIAFRGLH